MFDDPLSDSEIDDPFPTVAHDLEVTGNVYIMLEDRLEALFRKPEEYTILEGGRFKGSGRSVNHCFLTLLISSQLSQIMELSVL